jgi:hypothetical protein
MERGSSSATIHQGKHSAYHLTSLEEYARSTHVAYDRFALILTTPAGTDWPIREPEKRLSLRAGLPGAFVYDVSAHSLRNAKARGAPALERIPLAFASSWLVNSPASSKVLRRWALPPQFDVWIALVGSLEGPLTSPGEWGPAKALIGRLGDEPFLIEAVSKVLALLLPAVVPLMPEPARKFLLGESAGADADAFAKIADWFVRTTREHAEALNGIAASHEEVTLEGAQVLDRLLWFDSEGYRHFAGELQKDVPQAVPPET